MEKVSAKISVEKIDVDSDYERAQQYSVRNIPTVILVDGETEVKRFIGVQTEASYLKILG
tara:strand:- start:232 stop:411 length:180 start_codon:yes stop_codon:yes gene_type:complete